MSARLRPILACRPGRGGRVGYNPAIATGTPRPAAFLTAEQADALEVLAARVEARTGIQVVPAVTGKSDAYAELPWMAFALGASLSGLALVAADTARSQWVTANSALLHAIAILGVAAAAALCAVVAPPFGRLFLHASRAHVEVRHYAESLFLRHALFSSRRRTAVLVLVSLFERRIEILADDGLRGRVSEADWQAVVARITPHLRDGRAFHGLQEGLDAVEALLVSKGCVGSAGEAGARPHRPIEEQGE